MQPPILVVNADQDQSRHLCAVLNRQHFRTIEMGSLENLEGEIQTARCRVVIMDLDSLPVDNLFFRRLKRRNREVCIIGLSSRWFHPELEEAMSQHIHACLGKPVDEEDLVLWVKGLCHY